MSEHATLISGTDSSGTREAGGLLGIGIDLVEIARVERELERDGPDFVNAVLRPAEATYCLGLARPAPCIAARFAAKEATLKALGTGRVGSIGWHDIEIARDRAGQPSVVLHGATLRVADRLGVRRIHLSLTHDGGNAAAVVVLEP